MGLVTVQEAAKHLRIDDAELDDVDFLIDLQEKVDIASVLVLRYVNLPPDSYIDSSGTAYGVPYHLRAAVLIYTGILFKHRDGTSDEPYVYGKIPIAVSSILVQYRRLPVA